MAQESWKLEKDETDCELLKPPSSAGASSSASPTPVPPLVCAKSPSQDLAHQKLPKRSESPTPAAESVDPESSCRRTPKEELSKPVRFTNRCSSCQRRVGLTGFRCRCGSLFCGTHRYSDTHDCSFDYKAAGREEIAKANPLIRAAKIIKI